MVLSLTLKPFTMNFLFCKLTGVMFKDMNHAYFVDPIGNTKILRDVSCVIK